MLTQHFPLLFTGLILCTPALAAPELSGRWKDDGKAYFTLRCQGDGTYVGMVRSPRDLARHELRLARNLDRAWTLATSRTVAIWPVEADDLALALSSITRHPELPARDLLHLASCRRRGVEQIHTFDRALRTAVEGG